MRGRRSFFGGRVVVLVVLAALVLPCLLFAGGKKEKEQEQEQEQQPQVDDNGLVVGTNPIPAPPAGYENYDVSMEVDSLFKSPQTTVMEGITNTIVTVLDESTYGFIMGLAPFPKVAGDFMFRDEESALKAMRDNDSPFVMGNMGEYDVNASSEAKKKFPYVAVQTKTKTKRTQERVFGLVTKLFAGLFTAEIVFSAVYGYIQGKDSSVLKELLAKAVMAFLLFLLVAALPFLVEAFKTGFMVMAKTLSGAYDSPKFGSVFQKEWNELAGCSIYQMPGFVIRCYCKICETMDPSHLGANEVNLVKSKSGALGRGFLTNLLVSLLFLILKVVGFVLTLFAALHVMLNICECYLLMGMVMLLVPFSVFTPTKFLGGKAVYSLFGNVLELFVLMVVIYAAVPLAMTMSELVTAQIQKMSTSGVFSFSWPRANVYATAFFLEGDDNKVDGRCREILADTFNCYGDKLDNIKANEEYGLGSHEGGSWDADDFSAVVGDKTKLWNLIIDLESALKVESILPGNDRLQNVIGFDLGCNKDDEGKDYVRLSTVDTMSWYPSSNGGESAGTVLNNVLGRLGKYLEANFSNGQLKLEVYRNILNLMEEEDKPTKNPTFAQLPYKDKQEVVSMIKEVGWGLDENLGPLLSDVEMVERTVKEEETTYFSIALNQTDNDLLMFSIFVSILSIFMLTYFINQSSQITNALLSGNVSSEGFSAAMGRMVAAKAGGAVAGAAGGLTKSMAGGIRNTAASHAVNRMAQGRSAGVSRTIAGSAAMRGAMQTYEFNQKMANLQSASRGASVEHPGQG